MEETDYLVIGSGIAGLTFAVKISEYFPHKKVTVVTKSKEDESNTKYAQGGIAAVMDHIEDHLQYHIDDTLICGDGLCNKAVVEMVITEGPKRVRELMDWGTHFDRNPKGHLDLGREGGHSNNRVVHHKDQTGYEIERAILSKARLKGNIDILDFHFALDLIHENNCCYGAYVLNEKANTIFTFKAGHTIIATGGIGQVYGHTTNPAIATGDGIAIAKRANATIKDMEFIQFHPTALYSDTLTSTFLISEAVRGFGGYLRNKEGTRFMYDYDSRGELASRDIVSRGISKELRLSGNACVYLDCTHLDMIDFKQHFPMIYERCKTVGISIETDWIPVIPAQHYVCGGIAVDTNGKTSVGNLFACGECTYTGLHGANRLASNSLLEALVYANRIFDHLKNELDQSHSTFVPKTLTNQGWQNLDYILTTRKKLQELMQQHAGIVRNDKGLEHLENALLYWKTEIETMELEHLATKAFYELKNLLDVALLITDHSKKRTENKGCFFKIKTGVPQK